MSESKPDVELRLALAMRGGVSLAVWIGGACAEIDHLRRAPCSGGFWAPLLGRSEYSAVSVDVLAGASAGGLNGVLYAASQIYDFPYSEMRQIWLEFGSTEALVRRSENSPSLFMGDDYFGARLFDKLCDLGRAGAGRHPGRPAIDLSLAATLVEPVERCVPGPADESLFERRYASGFRFRQPAIPWTAAGADFPEPDARQGSDYENAMRRLALAGRSTSSYPGAFEAATMRATRGTTFDASPSRLVADEPVDMAGVLLDRGAAQLPPPSGRDTSATKAAREMFVVADGGILDNIPIARALHAVFAAPAESRTSRFLIYLHPGTASVRKSVQDSSREVRTDSVSVLRAAAAARITTETINADIDEIEAYNESIARAVTVRSGVFENIANASDLVAAATAAFASYAQSRTNEDARRIFGLLSDPVGALGGDPFPSGIGSTPIADAAWRSPMAAWSGTDRERFATELINAIRHSTASVDAKNVFDAGVKPLIRVVLLLIEWARFRETYLPPGHAADATTAKSALYGILAFLNLAMDRPRDLAWVSAVASRADRRPEPQENLAATLRSRVDRLVRFPRTEIPDILRSLWMGSDAGLSEARWAALARVPAAVAPDDDLDDFDDIRPELVHVIGEIVERLRAVELDGASLEARVLADDPAEHLERMLMAAPCSPSIDAVLAALEVMCYPEFVTGLPGRRPVSFVRLSCANRTPIAPAFRTVLDAAQQRDLWWDDSNHTVTEQQGVHVSLKLAGNELANFSAFLIAEWRANDWLWGRLDAVPTLVDLLVTPASIRQLQQGEGSAAVDAILQDHPLSVILDADQFHRWRCCVGKEIDNVVAGKDDPIPTIRNSFIARRQWEILGEELALPQGPMGRRRVLSDDDLRQSVATGRFGSETVNDNDHPDELADRFSELSIAAGNTVVWNMNHAPVTWLHLGERPAQLVRWAVANTVRWGTKRLTRQVHRPTADTAGKAAVEDAAVSKWKLRALVAAVIAAAVATAVFGFVSNRSAFLIGLGLGVLLVVPAVLALWWWLKRLFAPPAAVPLIDVRDVAKRLGVSQDCVRRLAAENKIPSVQAGDVVRFAPADVERWIAESRRQAGSKPLPVP